MWGVPKTAMWPHCRNSYIGKTKDKIQCQRDLSDYLIPDIGKRKFNYLNITLTLFTLESNSFLIGKCATHEMLIEIGSK
jgi:hypothetical protein